MKAETVRTVWFSKNSLLTIVLGIPAWGIGGLLWALFMTLFAGGGFLGWLIRGIFWAIFSWFLYSIWMLIALRDIKIRIPLQDRANLDKRLAEAGKRIWYSVEQESATSFVCKPKFGLPRLLQINRLDVCVTDDNIELAGPASVVKRVRKKLLTG